MEGEGEYERERERTIEATLSELTHVKRYYNRAGVVLIIYAVMSVVSIIAAMYPYDASVIRTTCEFIPINNSTITFQYLQKKCNLSRGNMVPVPVIMSIMLQVGLSVFITVVIFDCNDIDIIFNPKKNS